MIKNAKLFSITILLFINAATLIAQDGTLVTQVPTEIDEKSGNALRTEINRAEVKTIAKEWKSLMKDYDASVDINGTEIIAEEVFIELISGMKLTVLAKINPIKNNKSEFLVIFFNGDRAISSGNDISGYTAASEIIKRFALEISKEATVKFNETQIAALEKLNDNLEDLKKEQKEAKEEIEDAEERIEKAKELIKEKEYYIVENEKKQAELTQKITLQKEEVKKAKNEVELFE